MVTAEGKGVEIFVHFLARHYTRANSRPFKEIVEEFLTSLDAMNLLGVYKEKWAAR